MNKRSSAVISACILSCFMLTACGDKQPDVTEAVSTTYETPTETSAADVDYPVSLTDIAEASRLSLLLGKYKTVAVDYEIDYGEVYKQRFSFCENADKTMSYVSSSDTDSEYYDGKNDYWKDIFDEEASGYASLNLPGAESTTDMDNFIFSYTSDSSLSITGYTVNEDGGYIITAAETLNENYTDDDGNDRMVSYKYEYVFSTTKDLEMTGMKSSCTNSETGEVDSTMSMTVTFGGEMDPLPDFMSQTFEITVITLRDENTIEKESYKIPEGFMPFFNTPVDGDYVIAYDREGTEPIDDTMTLTEPCTIYAINSSKLAMG